MKTLKEYIVESFQSKKYVFKLKIAGDLNEDQEKSIKTLLEKYGVDTFSKQSTTPIQSLPLDFPTLKNVNVNIFDVTLNYPTTPQELHEYICACAKLNAGNVVVRNPNEPTEGYQTETDSKAKGALLNDPNYKELPKIKTDDFFGTKYNQSLLKELAKESKTRAKERGEKIPSEGEKSSPEYDTGKSTSPIAGKK
jgi:hypothetical protein